ncbi:MAG: hypothetical protein RIQ89_2060 [Bacteroidota bacterium]|jgi:DNA-binding LytR/AlgR family response regulator
MKVLILEDEPLAGMRLQRMLLQVEPSAHVEAIIDSVEGALLHLQTHGEPDLYLMDIELSDGQSFELFSLVDITAPVIFVTAYDEYALKAFKINTIDYLLKPISEQDLVHALSKFKRTILPDAEKLKAAIHQLIISDDGQYKKRFLVKIGKRLKPLPTNEILYIVSEDKLSFAISNERHKYHIDASLEELEQQLNPIHFFRINRQVIASKQSIRELIADVNGKLKLHIYGLDEEVMVSRDKSPHLKKWLSE